MVFRWTRSRPQRPAILAVQRAACFKGDVGVDEEGAPPQAELVHHLNESREPRPRPPPKSPAANGPGANSQLDRLCELRRSPFGGPADLGCGGGLRFAVRQMMDELGLRRGATSSFTPTSPLEQPRASLSPTAR